MVVTVDKHRRSGQTGLEDGPAERRKPHLLLGQEPIFEQPVDMPADVYWRAQQRF